MRATRRGCFCYVVVWVVLFLPACSGGGDGRQDTEGSDVQGLDAGDQTSEVSDQGGNPAECKAKSTEWVAVLAEDQDYQELSAPEQEFSGRLHYVPKGRSPWGAYEFYLIPGPLFVHVQGEADRKVLLEFAGCQVVVVGKLAKGDLGQELWPGRIRNKN